MSKALSILGATAALGLSVGAASGAIHMFTFSLDGSQEVPPVATPGTGTATVTLDDVSGVVSVSGSYTGLIGTVTAAHIHGLAPAGVNAGVLIGLSHTGGNSGTLSP